VWRPVVDGRTLSYDPTWPNAPSDVPLLVGTVLHEAFTALGHPEYQQIKEAEARQLVRGFFGAPGDAIYDVYRKAFPQASPFDVSAMARATGRMRSYCVKMALHRAALNAAPSYLYWVQWQSRNFGGLAMSHHELEMPLVFQNSDITPEFTGATDEARALSVKMTDAWLAFARTGNPAIKALPAWNAVSPTTPTCMVFDEKCSIDTGSDLAAIELFFKSRYQKA
jgi:para-nitrobenzyl esterase